MHTIGIDMSKNTFHAAFDEEVVREYQNTKEGIAIFIAEIEARGITKESTTIGVESTGVYHLLLCLQVFTRGWNIVVLNPLLTAQMIAAGLRMVKHDRKDARIVRLATSMGKGYPFRDTGEVLALKALVSERADLVRMRADLKRRMHAHTVREQALDIKLYNSYEAVQDTLTREIKAIERQLSSYAAGTQRLLRSLPGVGLTAAALLVSYVGDINRFASPEQLVAYIGIDPRIKQSGTSIHGRGYITKRGNELLRHTLFQSAFIAKRHDPVLGQYYRKKRGEGKHHTAVLCAIERKLIHWIFAVWKRGTPFEKQTP